MTGPRRRGKRSAGARKIQRMASSRCVNPLHIPYLDVLFPPRTRGILGLIDAADPSCDAVLGDTPGALGIGDGADPQRPYLYFPDELVSLIIATSAPARASVNADPGDLLGDPNVNPVMARAALAALDNAVADGLSPRVHEAFRDPARSDSLAARTKAGGPQAAPGWSSCHNYGLGIDVYLYDAKGRYIDNKVKGWYKLYKRLAKFMIAAGFVWGESFGSGDSDHFEYHPNWSGGAGGALLTKVKAWAIETASPPPAAAPSPAGDPSKAAGKAAPTSAARKDPPLERWLPYFWWAAGAGGTAPPAAQAAKLKM